MSERSLIERIFDVINKTATASHGEEEEDKQEGPPKPSNITMPTVGEGFKEVDLVPKLDIDTREVLFPQDMTAQASKRLQSQTFTHRPEGKEKFTQFGLLGGPRSATQAHRFAGMASQVPDLLDSGDQSSNFLDVQNEDILQRRRGIQEGIAERRKTIKSASGREKLILRALGVYNGK